MRAFGRFSTLDSEFGRTPVVRADPSRGTWVPIVMFAWLVAAWKIFEMLFAFGATCGGFGTVKPYGASIDLSRNVDPVTAIELASHQVLLLDAQDRPFLDPRRERICTVPIKASGLSEGAFDVISGTNWRGPTHLLVHPDQGATYQSVIDGIELAARAAQVTGTSTITVSLIDEDEAEEPAAEAAALVPRCSLPRPRSALRTSRVR